MKDLDDLRVLSGPADIHHLLSCSGNIMIVFIAGLFSSIKFSLDGNEIRWHLKRPVEVLTS